MADAIEEIIKEVKALRSKLEEMEKKGMDVDTINTRIDELQGKLDKDPNFGSWD